MALLIFIMVVPVLKLDFTYFTVLKIQSTHHHLPFHAFHMPLRQLGQVYGTTLRIQVRADSNSRNHS